MKVKCPHCLPKEGMDLPPFSPSEKNRLMELSAEPLVLTKFIKDNYALDSGAAKYMVTHINSIHGRCNRCGYTALDKEYINCPACGALNFNWKII